MLKKIDDFLNGITMYRLVLYYLMGLIGIATVFGLFGILPYSPFSILFSVSVLVVVSWATNFVFAKAFNAQSNVESVYITALILTLIISPYGASTNLAFLGWAAVWSMASKFIFAIGKKQIFNPAGVAVAITAIFINQSASWWVGTASMMPFVLIGGLLIVRKIKRSDLVFSFVASAVATILVFTILKGASPVSELSKIIFTTPLLFFAFTMLTEPLTSPPTKFMPVLFGILVGFLFAPQVHIGTFYFTPELALVIGNIFSYIVSPKYKLVLKLKEKLRIAPDVYDFVFAINQKLSFTPGQYMEWTLAHDGSDDRGNRRYFTIASSPTENEVRLGVKFNNPSSSFKKSLLTMDTDKEIVTSQLSGDFTLPKNPEEKLVLIAGGIGITPFRSMIKYLIDRGERRQIILIYSNKTEEEIVYRDVFDRAQEELGIKVIYTLTDLEKISPAWQGERGRLDESMIRLEVPDFMERKFYLSGPHAMVTGFEDTLGKMQVPKNQIITDYFPGFA
jgi:ferredoxin-NADP reductase